MAAVAGIELNPSRAMPATTADLMLGMLIFGRFFIMLGGVYQFVNFDLIPIDRCFRSDGLKRAFVICSWIYYPNLLAIQIEFVCVAVIFYDR